MPFYGPEPMCAKAQRITTPLSQLRDLLFVLALAASEDSLVIWVSHKGDYDDGHGEL